jgi:tetratricopeptide (TPR) repeat protein
VIALRPLARQSAWGSSTRRAATLLGALALAALVAGCAGSLAHQRQLDREREQALKLIDEGRALDKNGSPLLALERFNRSVMIHETPGAWFQQGKVFEEEGKTAQAATAYARALELAPDDQEARLAVLALGHAPPGQAPTPEEFKLAAARRADRAAHLAAKADRGPATAPGAGQPSQETLNEAAARRLPTLAEVQAVVFSPEATHGTLPSAENPTYETGNDIILGTYAYHLRKAQQMRRRDQVVAAEEEYQRAIEADPSKIDARLELGDMLLREEHAERALYHYNRAIADFPNSPRPYLRLGIYYAGIHRPDLARRYYRLAIQKDPNFMEAYNNLAVMDMNEGKFADARKILDDILRRDPTFANAYLNRGIIASDIDKNRQKALDDFNRYIGLNGPRAAEARRWVRELQGQPN